MDRDALLSHLALLAGQLNLDELAVVTRIASRLVLGQPQYGGLGIDRDPRNYAVEWQEELLDACAYGAMLLEKAQRAK